MGIDNLLDLPFWQGVAEYPDKCDKIYILDRDISEEIGQNKLCKTEKTFDKGGNIFFNKTASWNFKKEADLMVADNCENDTLPLNKRLVELNHLQNFNFSKLETKPSPTSSSLLRIALIKYYSEENDKYLEALRTLEGREPVNRKASHTDKMADPWYASLSKSGHLETSQKIARFDKDFSAAFPGMIGGKRSKRAQRKSKRTRRSRWR